jgi:AmmeMemoRadiSam system protein A
MGATRSTTLDEATGTQLLSIAARSIEATLGLASAAPPDPATLGPALGAWRASFVTLTVDGALRGCCGSLEPLRPLALDTWRNARAAASLDRRFVPLAPADWRAAGLEVSVLTPQVPLAVRSEAELLGQLVVGRDGLVLEWRGQRTTFLPKVWEQLPEPLDFLRHLKHKAGWDPGFWAPDLRVWRYETESVSAGRVADLARPAASRACPPVS